jgi:transposase
MDSHTHSAQVGRLHIVETGRRRRWSDEEKLRIVMESAAGPRLISATARRHNISPSQLFSWRRSFGLLTSDATHGSDPVFLSVAVDDNLTAAASGQSSSRVALSDASTSQRIEIEVPGGRVLRVDTQIDMGLLACLLAVVDPRP